MLNLLNEARNYRFVIRKWNIANGHSNTNYDEQNKIIYRSIEI